jgi:HD-GYP domain-containing protein (c-di-GMP phosphodiesterase class II)
MEKQLPILAPEASLVSQERIVESHARRAARLAKRERWAELAVGGAFVVGAALCAVLVPEGRPFELSQVAAIVAAIAIASLVRFDVGSAYTMPLQLAFVPALFAVPLNLVPVVVAVGLLCGRLLQAARGPTAWSRLPLVLGDSVFTLGPVVVLGAAGAPGVTEASPWILLAAFAAQVLCDGGFGAIREAINRGASLREQMTENAWIYLVDFLLAPAGIVIALGATHGTWVLPMMLPFFALLFVFARERDQRLAGMIELNEVYRGTARALGDVVEHDDAYTGLHTRGVLNLAIAVADEMELDPLAKRNTELGALLHDVGKVVIPNEIINKAGPLDEQEWKLIKTHTVEGQRILDEIGGLMSTVGRVVRSAHERWDGDGYPDGLKGEEIPLESRIIFCCDAFNAITTTRSYRPARSAHEALEELRLHAGTQFDPDVVAALSEVIERDLARSAGAEVEARVGLTPGS